MISPGGLNQLIALLEPIFGNGKPLPAWGDEEYKLALRDIRLSGVGPQICHFLRGKGLLDETPAFFRNALKQDYQQALVQNLYIQKMEREILAAFEAAAIPVIPLKGPRFAEGYFGHMAARPSSDIDLLVHPEDLKRAEQCVEALHFQKDKQVHNHVVLAKATGPGQDALAVELHWTLDKKNWSSLDDRRFWEEAGEVAGYRHVKELSPTHTLYFICLHGMRHRMDSMKYVMDIVQILAAEGTRIDMGRLLREAASDKTAKRVKIALSIACGLFPELPASRSLPFPLLETAWTYSAIVKKQTGVKDMEYYRYISFFKFQIFDTLKHTIMSQKQIYEHTAKYSSFEGN